MIQIQALPRTARPTTGLDTTIPLPVLIRVPRTDDVPSPLAARHEGRLPRGAAPAPSPAPARRMRRRLRREVKLAGCALLAIAPVLAVAGYCDLGGTVRMLRAATARPEATTATSGSPAPAEGGWAGDGAAHVAPPMVLLSIEGIGRAAEPRDEAEVVFPGYLLPDDSHEEAPHEGS